MSEHHEVTNANDVELILQAGGTKRGTPQDMGRVVVDEFSISRSEDDSLESGVGHRQPAGVSNGDIEHNWSFTILGEDVSTFQMIANENGESRFFSFTALNRDGEEIKWEFALDGCKATDEELTGSSGDTLEYSVEGIATTVDKTGTRHDGSSAWE